MTPSLFNALTAPVYKESWQLLHSSWGCRRLYVPLHCDAWRHGWSWLLAFYVPKPSTKVSMNPDIYLHSNTVYASRINTVILFFSVWRYLGDLVNIFSCLWAQHEGTWKQVINCSLRESQIFFLTLIVKIPLLMSVSECVFSLPSAEDVDTASEMLWGMM